MFIYSHTLGRGDSLYFSALISRIFYHFIFNKKKLFFFLFFVHLYFVVSKSYICVSIYLFFSTAIGEFFRLVFFCLKIFLLILIWRSHLCVFVDSLLTARFNHILFYRKTLNFLLFISFFLWFVVGRYSGYIDVSFLLILSKKICCLFLFSKSSFVFLFYLYIYQ